MNRSLVIAFISGLIIATAWPVAATRLFHGRLPVSEVGVFSITKDGLCFADFHWRVIDERGNTTAFATPYFNEFSSVATWQPSENGYCFVDQAPKRVRTWPFR